MTYNKLATVQTSYNFNRAFKRNLTKTCTHKHKILHDCACVSVITEWIYSC